MLLYIHYIFISLDFFSVCPAIKGLISQVCIFANTDLHIVSNKSLYKRYDCKQIRLGFLTSLTHLVPMLT